MNFVNIRGYEKSKEAKKYLDKEIRFVANRNVAKTADLGFKVTNITISNDLVLMVRSAKKKVKAKGKPKVKKKAVKKVVKKAARRKK